MRVDQITAGNHCGGYKAGRTERHTAGDPFANVLENRKSDYARCAERENALHSDDRGKTDTKIITKPDGSRVLVVTMKIGGMETVMSMKISEPAEMPNDAGKIDTENLREEDMTPAEP